MRSLSPDDYDPPQYSDYTVDDDVVTVEEADAKHENRSFMFVETQVCVCVCVCMRVV